MDQQNQQPHNYSAPNPQAYYTPPAPKQHPMIQRRAAIAIGIGALILGAGIGAAGKNNKTADTTASSTPKATATVTTTQAMSGAAPAAVTTTVTAKLAAAPPAPTTSAAPKQAVVFSTSGNGIKKTASFTTGAEWSVTYTFDCSGAGGQGNFVLQVDGDLGDMLANALAAKGGDTSYEHNAAGSHYLSVNSECDWTLKVTNG